MSRVLVCCADDFGICVERDRGILDALDQCAVLTDVSVIVNGTSFTRCSAADAAERAASLLQRLSSRPVNIGLHFNITEFAPCAPSTRPFRGKLPLLAALDQLDAAEIEAELRAQLCRFGELFNGRVPSHIDGHNHVHVFPRVRDVVARVAAELAIGRVCLPLEHALVSSASAIDCDALCKQLAQHATPRDSMPVQGEYCHVVTKFALDAERVFRAHSLVVCDAFVGMMLHRHCDTAENAERHVLEQIDAAFAQPNVRIVELMCHPGRCAPDSDNDVDAFAKSIAREVELEMLIRMSASDSPQQKKLKNQP
jgi:predicted glycoside hydrolase/deacetylase ChbG (UPF0249 family)